MKNNRQTDLPLTTLTPDERQTLAELLRDHTVYAWALAGNRIFYRPCVANGDNAPVSASSTATFRETCVHEVSQTVFDRIVEGQSAGKHRVRLYLRLDDSDWHRWEAIYDVPEAAEDGTRGDVRGILVKIDNVVGVEKRIAQAVAKVNEVSLRENFIANISHDIRTPLNAISGFAQLLTDDSCDDDERAMYGDIIRSNIGQMLSLIDGVVEKALEETDGMTFKIREVNVGEIVETCYRTNSILVPSHLRFHLDNKVGKGLTFKVDPVRTRQVVNNFISNAFKFTPEGSVTLSCSYNEAEGKVRIAVTDTGIGVSEARREHLLDRFAKVNDGDKGTGLGLDICQKIVRSQGGEIGFDSVEGKGSTFWFTQPAENGKEEQS